eukprot:s861_g9.t1
MQTRISTSLIPLFPLPCKHDPAMKSNPKSLTTSHRPLQCSCRLTRASSISSRCKGKECLNGPRRRLQTYCRPLQRLRL